LYIAFQTGNWFKRYHIGEVRLKKLMKEICMMTDINLENRKITNHAGRKTMVQALQHLGQDTECIRYQSHHKSDQGLQPYVLPHDQQQLNMMTSLACEIHKETCRLFEILPFLILTNYLMLKQSQNILASNQIISTGTNNQEKVNGTFSTAKDGNIFIIQ